MTITVILPNALRPHAAGLDRVPLEAETAGEALAKLVQQYPRLQAHLPAEPRPGAAIYRNGSLISKLQGLETPLADGDRLTIIVPEGDL